MARVTARNYGLASRVDVITSPANNYAVRNLYNAQGYLRQVQRANDPSLIYWRVELAIWSSAWIRWTQRALGDRNIRL
ncbi:MAG: hypothetical protein ACR2KU_04290 [Gammaproteobacteria bacterium]|nr:hypothetical protein [Gammaproteobacteria bacterium]